MARAKQAGAARPGKNRIGPLGAMARSSFNGQKEGIKNSVTKSMARRAAVGKTIAAKFGGAKGSKAKGGTAGGGG